MKTQRHLGSCVIEVRIVSHFLRISGLKSESVNMNSPDRSEILRAIQFQGR